MKHILPRVALKKKVSPAPPSMKDKRAKENADLLQALFNSPFEQGLRAAQAHMRVQARRQVKAKLATAMKEVPNE